jgi:hypothetical protein
MMVEGSANKYTTDTNRLRLAVEGTVGFGFRFWSGARDLNPGPHGPEPARRCVLLYPGGSFCVLPYSKRGLFVSARVL